MGRQSGLNSSTRSHSGILDLDQARSLPRSKHVAINLREAAPIWEAGEIPK
jgi:hypothetical protein